MGSLEGDLLPDEGAWNESSPLALAAASTTGNVDTLTQSQMKQALDRAEFKKARIPEIEGLTAQTSSNMFQSAKCLADIAS